MYSVLVLESATKDCVLVHQAIVAPVKVKTIPNVDLEVGVESGTIIYGHCVEIGLESTISNFWRISSTNFF